MDSHAQAKEANDQRESAHLYRCPELTVNGSNLQHFFLAIACFWWNCNSFCIFVYLVVAAYLCCNSILYFLHHVSPTLGVTLVFDGRQWHEHVIVMIHKTRRGEVSSDPPSKASTWSPQEYGALRREGRAEGYVHNPFSAFWPSFDAKTKVEQSELGTAVRGLAGKL